MERNDTLIVSSQVQEKVIGKQKSVASKLSVHSILEVKLLFRCRNYCPFDQFQPY